jgi:galactose mutarotase-like enzyme
VSSNDSSLHGIGGCVAVELSYRSMDGEEGYPGNLDVTARFELNNDNEFTMTFKAKTDAPTVVNLCNHGYWNLAGHNSGNILGHELEINADRYTAVDGGLIPTGELTSVHKTVLDFTTPHLIGERIAHFKDDVAMKGGYDHNYVINRNDYNTSSAETKNGDEKEEEKDDEKASKSKKGSKKAATKRKKPSKTKTKGAKDVVFAARLSDPASGRVMEVSTSAPGTLPFSFMFDSLSFVSSV